MNTHQVRSLIYATIIAPLCVVNYGFGGFVAFLFIVVGANLIAHAVGDDR